MISLANAIAVIEFGVELTSGKLTDPAEIARRFAFLGLDLAPVDDLKASLTEEARRRDDMAVDIAETIKAGP